MSSLNRRKFLSFTATTIGLPVAGCLSNEFQGMSGTSRSTPSRTRPAGNSRQRTSTVNDGKSSAPSSCPNGITPLEPWWVVEGPGPLGGFDLSIRAREISIGGTLSATLTNITNEEKSTGNKQKYDIQYQTESGWETIFGIDQETAMYTSEGITHQPGEGFSWNLTFTRSGLTDAVNQEPMYSVCAPLESGTYRFVYWGITTEQEVRDDYETDYGIGIAFSVSQE